MGWVRELSFDRERIAWWLVAIALAVAVGYVVASFLGTFLLGLFVYYATRPMYRRLLRRVHQPTLTAVAALFGIALPGLILLGYTVVVSVRELGSLAGVGLDQFQGVLGPYVDTSVLLDPEQLADVARANQQALLDDRSADALRELLGSVLAVLGVLASTAFGLVVMLIVAFYLLRDDHRLAKWFRTEVVGDDSPTVAFARAVDGDLETVYFGNILTAFVIAIVAAVIYNALDAFAPAAVSVPSPTLLGLLTGLASLVPVVGMKLVYIPIGLLIGVTAFLADPTLVWFPVVFLIVTFVVVDSVPELLLRPYVSGRDLHTGLVMLAYIVGPVLFGWYGLFLGPLLLVLVVHFARTILPELVESDRFATPDADARPMTDGWSAETDDRIPKVRPPVGPLASRRPRRAADSRESSDPESDEPSPDDPQRRDDGSHGGEN
ncbi:AI-2E family transporter [Halorussus sp. GCM10023401]|uniref:AI-2E family transporter n=1 Tax=Halorussus sp. GCM10023401 TaxID=3252680 RepID=UPI003610A5A5